MKIGFNQRIKQTLFAAMCLAVVAVALGHTVISHNGAVKGNISIQAYKEPDGEKARRWQAMEEEVASWSDALGLGIDPAIKNAVIVLNLLGFKTQQSCEGHIDWGLPYPWVSFDFRDEKLNELYEKRRENFKRIDEEIEEIQKKYPNLSEGEVMREQQSEKLIELYQQNNFLSQTIDRLSKLKFVSLNDLINRFYQNRIVDHDHMLAFQGLDRIYSLGGDWQIVRDENERQRKLAEYQEEMNLFVDFLIQHYFEN